MDFLEFYRAHASKEDSFHELYDHYRDEDRTEDRERCASCRIRLLLATTLAPVLPSTSEMEAVDQAAIDAGHTHAPSELIAMHQLLVMAGIVALYLGRLPRGVEDRAALAASYSHGVRFVLTSMFGQPAIDLALTRLVKEALDVLPDVPIPPGPRRPQ